MEVIVRLLLTRLLLRYRRSIECILSCCTPTPIQMIPVSLLLCLLVIADVECLSASNGSGLLLLGHAIHKATTALVMRVLHLHFLARRLPSYQLTLIGAPSFNSAV